MVTVHLPVEQGPAKVFTKRTKMWEMLIWKFRLFFLYCGTLCEVFHCECWGRRFWNIFGMVKWNAWRQTAWHGKLCVNKKGRCICGWWCKAHAKRVVCVLFARESTLDVSFSKNTNKWIYALYIFLLMQSNQQLNYSIIIWRRHILPQASASSYCLLSLLFLPHLFT